MMITNILPKPRARAGIEVCRTADAAVVLSPDNFPHQLELETFRFSQECQQGSQWLRFIVQGALQAEVKLQSGIYRFKPARSCCRRRSRDFRGPEGCPWRDSNPQPFP